MSVTLVSAGAVVTDPSVGAPDVVVARGDTCRDDDAPTSMNTIDRSRPAAFEFWTPAKRAGLAAAKSDQLQPTEADHTLRPKALTDQIPEARRATECVLGREAHQVAE